MNDSCRYCNKPVEAKDMTSTLAYWSGQTYTCHKDCKEAGLKQEVIECQTIDADCNDCIHFKRGEVVKRLLSCMENKKPSMKLVNMGVINGHCLKFDRPTQAFPNKWTGRECFEHRRKV